MNITPLTNTHLILLSGFTLWIQSVKRSRVQPTIVKLKPKLLSNTFKYSCIKDDRRLIQINYYFIFIYLGKRIT